MKILSNKFYLPACLLLAVSACNQPAPPVYVNSGDPERLIDLSSEATTFGLSSKSSLTKLTKSVNKDRPSSAELKCSLKNTRCAQAKEILERRSIPINLSTEKNNTVVLAYERTVVRDCNPRYADNMQGSRSFNHPAFGCATAGNMVQMVSDKKQFTNHNLLDLPDAKKAVQSYDGYQKPSADRKYSTATWENK